MHPIMPAALAALLFSSTSLAFAQPGKAASAPQASASASAPGPGIRGSGPRRGMGPRTGPDYTAGWSMMTPAERTEHRKQMADARTADECRAARDDHRKLMEQRAKERGMPTMPGPRRDACAGLRK